MEKPVNDYFPFAIEHWSSVETNELISYLNNLDENTKIVRVGPKGYTMFDSYRQEASKVYHLEVKPTDIVVASEPRSGTTWTQEIVWLIANNLDFATAASQPLKQRYAVMGTTFLSKSIEEITKISTLDHLLSFPDPRFIKTHLPLSLLPPKLLDTAKIVYVARNPRDQAVSLYFFFKLLKLLDPQKDFKTFWHLYMKGSFIWQPYFEHVKEAWEKRLHPNMLFLFYEELVKDLSKTLYRISTFLNKDYSDKQIADLVEYVSFENFKKNPSVNIDLDKEFDIHVGKEISFIRKGKVGGWRQYFNEDMTAQAQQWIEKNLEDCDLRYPSMEHDVNLL